MWYYVYILELSNGKHYIGCTINLKERYARHKKGYVPATKPSSGKTGVVLHFLIDIKPTILKSILNPGQAELLQ
jgi:predicted GIY-YIG superfamily endonuclease